MITIHLLGCMSVDVHGAGLPWGRPSRKQWHILGILAIHAGQTVSKERLADLLWHGAPPRSYVSTLESYVSVLRRTLGVGSGRTSPLATRADGYCLEVDGRVWVDHARFQVLGRAAQRSTGARAVRYAAEAVDLLSGDLVADVPYEEWAVRARDEFERQVVDACVHGAQQAIATGDLGNAVRLAEIAIERDTLCEQAWRLLIMAHWRAGRRGRALAAYCRLREVTHESLGEEPERKSTELYLAILRGVKTADSEDLAADREELETLLALLRQALDASPNLRIMLQDGRLVGPPRQVVEAAV